MNKDIVIDAGINISQVTGLDKVIGELQNAAKEAISKGTRAGLSEAVSRDNLANRRLSAANDFVSLIQDVDKGDLPQQLVRLRTARRYLNQVAAHNYSTEAYVELAAAEEAINARTNKVRADLRATGGIESSLSITQRETIKRLKGEHKYQQDKFFRILSQVEDSESFGKLSPRQQLDLINDTDKAREDLYKAGESIDKYNRRIGRKARSAIDAEDEKINKEYKWKFDDLRDNVKKTATNTGFTASKIGGFLGAAGAVYAAGSLGKNIADNILGLQEGYYSSDQKARFVRDKRNEWTKKLYGYGGWASGAAIGGAIGSILGPLTGLIGAFLGGAGAAAYGFISGGQKGVRSKAADLSKRDALDTMRYRGLYSATAGSGGWQFAKAVEGTGLATASDVEALASTSQEFQAALAFGGVSDSQMLGLSMLPNYYAALASGATPEQAFSAYMKDIQGMSPGLAQYASKLAGVPDNLRALANNPTMANRALTEGFAQAQQLEAAISPYVLPYAHGYYGEQLKNLELQQDSWKKGAKSDWMYDFDKDYANMNYSQSLNLTGGSSNAATNALNNVTDKLDLKIKNDNFVQRELNVYVGEQKTTIGTVYTDKQFSDQISYAVGVM